jgi:hypothetical protein
MSVAGAAAIRTNHEIRIVVDVVDEVIVVTAAAAVTAAAVLFVNRSRRLTLLQRRGALFASHLSNLFHLLSQTADVAAEGRRRRWRRQH